MFLYLLLNEQCITISKRIKYSKLFNNRSIKKIKMVKKNMEQDENHHETSLIMRIAFLDEVLDATKRYNQSRALKFLHHFPDNLLN